MTPGARVAAAIEILDQMAQGTPAEQALTRWARRSRFAGSKDRAAIRDHVFDVLRSYRSAAHFGQGETGRHLMRGLLHLQGADIDTLFDGAGHAPPPLSEAERALPQPARDKAVEWNLPDWLVPQFEASLAKNAGATAKLLCHRAPITLRVNTAKISREEAALRLTQEGITAAANPVCATALTVLEGARKLRNSTAYAEGLVELQDAASQAVAARVTAGPRVLDYCAGGGGKALALAAAPQRMVFAHDSDPARMVDLPARAARADCQITLLPQAGLHAHAPFDAVLCDAPCSGSGAWRRAPGGKWSLTAERLQTLCDLQDSILDQAAALVAPQGVLAYATCSVLRVENEDRIAAFVDRNPTWQVTHQERFDVSPDADGFYTAHLTQV